MGEMFFAAFLWYLEEIINNCSWGLIKVGNVNVMVRFYYSIQSTIVFVKMYLLPPVTDNA